PHFFSKLFWCKLFGTAADFACMEFVWIKRLQGLRERLSGLLFEKRTIFVLYYVVQRPTGFEGNNRCTGGQSFDRRNAKIFVRGEQERLCTGHVVVHFLVAGIGVEFYGWASYPAQGCQFRATANHGERQAELGTGCHHNVRTFLWRQAANRYKSSSLFGCLLFSKTCNANGRMYHDRS